MKLTPKLMLSFLSIGMLPLLLFGFLSIQTAEEGLHKLASQQLESVRDLKKSAVKRYFETVSDQLTTIADTQVVLQAMFYLPNQVRQYNSQTLSKSKQAMLQSELIESYAQLPFIHNKDMTAYVMAMDNTALSMQQDYLLSNPHPYDQRAKLDKASGTLPYHAIHASMHPALTRFANNAHFRDLYLVDNQSGRILYSVNKGIDFGTSLTQGPLKESSLAQAFTLAKQLQASETAYTDFSHYLPAGDESVGFVSTPILFDGKTLGFVIAKITTEQLNSIMTDRSGMGETGDTYIVGSEHLMHTHSYKEGHMHDEHTHDEMQNEHPQNASANHSAVTNALAGKTGVAAISSFDNTPVLSAYTPVDIKGLHWALIAEMDQTEAYASTYRLEQNALIMFTIALIFIIGYAFIVARGIARPIHKLVGTIKQIQESGDFAVRHKEIGKDEVGTAATAINELMDDLQSSFNNIQSVMDAIATGEFTQRVNSEHNGDLGKLKIAVNASANSVSNTMDALNEVMNGLSEGDFSVRLDPSVKGELKSKVDQAMQRMDEAVHAITETMQAAAKGEFANRITVELKGDMVKLKSSMNQSLEEVQHAIEEINHVAKSMAQGDLTQTVQGNYDGELAVLKESLNSSIVNLGQMVASVRDAAITVSEGANTISSGSTDLNTRTQQQAATLEETASSMEEMTATVEGTTEHAKHAHKLADEAQKTSINGVSVMDKTMGAMQEIEESSTQISNIITLIDSIAFQTNLLALNAAVEAARAGEAGRGFAVVAGEVRNLAGRSADAAHQIKELIERTVHQISGGTKLVHQSSDALNEINAAIQKVNGLVSEISSSSEEQTEQLRQLNHAVSEMDQSTQKNAHLVESLTANAGSVDQQANALQSSVSGFKIGNANSRLPTKKLTVKK